MLSNFNASLAAESFRLLLPDEPVSPHSLMEPDGIGQNTFSLQIDGIQFHSLRNPEKEARRMLEGYAVSPDSLVILVGAGLGYIPAILMQESQCTVLWFEHDPRILSTALGLFDYRLKIKKGFLKAWIHLPNEKEFSELLKSRFSGNIHVIPHRPSLKYHSGYRQFFEYCVDAINRRSVNQATLARFDKVWARNISINLPFFSRGNPVSSLFNIASGKTAIVAGAGPSLWNEMPEIIRQRNSSILIAVDTAVKVLTRYGLDPDIIVSVDPQPINRHYLEDYRGHAILVTDPSTTFYTIARFPTLRTYFYETPFKLSRILSDIFEYPIGEISFGGSVSTNAYDLACKMGCNPIYLAGQDLAFTDSLAHCRGATLENYHAFKESRLITRETYNFRQIYALPARFVKTYSGRQSRTNDKLLIFIRWFEQRIAADQWKGLNVYRFSKNGAVIAALRPLENLDSNNASVTEKHDSLIANQHPSFSFVHGMVSWQRESVQDSPVERLRSRLIFLRHSLADYIQKIEILIHQVKALIGHIEQTPVDGRKNTFFIIYNQLNEKITQMEQKILDETSLNHILGDSLQRLIYSLENPSENGDEGETESPAWQNEDDMFKSAVRTLRLYSGLRKSANNYLRWFHRTLSIMDRYFDSHSQIPASEKEP